MPAVRFRWDAQLVSVRRQMCPHAKWDKMTRAWIMNAEDADRFLQAAHTHLELVRASGQIAIDAAQWTIGFVQDAPFRRGGDTPSHPERPILRCKSHS